MDLGQNNIEFNAFMYICLCLFKTFHGWTRSPIELMLTNNALSLFRHTLKNEKLFLLFLKGQVLYPEGHLFKPHSKASLPQLKIFF